jgi:hypothetical protein
LLDEEKYSTNKAREELTNDGRNIAEIEGRVSEGERSGIQEANSLERSEEKRRESKIIDEYNPDTPFVKGIEERSLPEEAALFLDSLYISFSDPNYRNKINLQTGHFLKKC